LGKNLLLKKGILIPLLLLILLKGADKDLCGSAEIFGFAGVVRALLDENSWNSLHCLKICHGAFASLTRSTGKPGPSVQSTDAAAAEYQQLQPHPWQGRCHHVLLAKISSEEGTQPTNKK